MSSSRSVLAAVLLTASLCIVAARRPVPLVFDTDIGQEMDDMFALAYGLARPELFDFRMILTSTHNTTGRATLVAKILHEVNRTDVDIGAGFADTNYPTTGARQIVHGVGDQWPWVGEYTLADFPGRYFPDGVARVETLLETQATEAEPWMVVAVGPMTNVGHIFIRKPHLKRRVVLVTMGGSVFRGYDRQPPPTPEYNVAYNASASQMVYNDTANVPFYSDICAAPVDAGNWFQIYGENYQFLLSATAVSPLARVTIEGYRVWFAGGHGIFPQYRTINPANVSCTLYDGLAMFQAGVVAQTLGFGCSAMPWLDMRAVRIAVTADGMTVPNSTGVRPVQESIGWVGGGFNGSYPLGTHMVAVLSRGL